MYYRRDCPVAYRLAIQCCSVPKTSMMSASTTSLSSLSFTTSESLPNSAALLVTGTSSAKQGNAATVLTTTTPSTDQSSKVGESQLPPNSITHTMMVTIGLTSPSTSMSQFPPAPEASSASVGSDVGMQSADRISLGVGIGIGLPACIATIIGVYLTLRQRNMNRYLSWYNWT